jgi:ubiquinone/menaquinone biosynthesis C-methylase UbiE
MFGRDNDRNRATWLRDTIEGLPNGLRLLDAGAGEQRNRQYCRHLEYVSQDFCQYRGDGDGSALQTGAWDTTKIDLVSDITEIPVADQSFDVVLCTEVLEHIPDPLAAIREFSRVLKPGGVLVLTAPFCSLTHFAPYHFASGLSRFWYERHLPIVGCAIERIQPNGGWLDFVAQELWRLPWIGKTYASRALGWLALALALPALAVMRLLKGMDKGSSELLTFGWQVVARKSK